jgi:hypothetical protein
MPILSKNNDWGGNSISKVLYDYLLDTLPEGKTILELGSGWGTGQLMEHWNVWSIESEPAWYGKYNKTQSIFVPITEKGGWYDHDKMKATMAKLVHDYDLLLVDGPFHNRHLIVDNFYMFNHATPIVFDDVRRARGKHTIEAISALLNRPYVTHGTERSMFGVIDAD